MSTLTSKQDCASLWELWRNRKQDLTVSHYVMMVLLICLFFGCGYWADLWRDCSQIRESCQCTWHSWLFVSSCSLLTQRTQDYQDTLLFLTEYDFPGTLLIFTMFLLQGGFFHHRHSHNQGCGYALDLVNSTNCNAFWNLKFYVIFYPLSSFPQEPPQRDVCLSADLLGSPKSCPWPSHSSLSSC